MRLGPLPLGPGQQELQPEQVPRIEQLVPLPERREPLSSQQVPQIVKVEPILVQPLPSSPQLELEMIPLEPLPSPPLFVEFRLLGPLGQSPLRLAKFQLELTPLELRIQRVPLAFILPELAIRLLKLELP